MTLFDNNEALLLVAMGSAHLKVCQYAVLFRRASECD